MTDCDHCVVVCVNSNSVVVKLLKEKVTHATEHILHNETAHKNTISIYATA